MRDVDAAAVALARADAALVAAVADRIHAGDAPPAAFDGTTQSCVVLKSRGGPVRFENILDVSIQAKCYGPTAVAAWQVYQALYAALHETYSGAVAFSVAETIGQQVTEPGTGRVFILAYFRMQVRP